MTLILAILAVPAIGLLAYLAWKSERRKPGA